MEFGLREWLIVIGIIVIAGILFDGWRRMRGGKGRLKFKLDRSFANMPDDDGDPDEGLIRVESPMVGTFYRAPSPDASPFVEEGQRVAPGDTLCLIEAMKLFNEIQAEHGGIVRRILVENAEPAEFGQLLFLIEP